MSLLDTILRRKTVTVPESELRDIAATVRQAAVDIAEVVNDATPVTAAHVVNRVPAPRYESGVDTSFAVPPQTFMHALNQAGAPVAIHHHEYRWTRRREGYTDQDMHERGYRWLCTGCGQFGGKDRWIDNLRSPETSLTFVIEGANGHATKCRFPVQTIPAKEV